MRQSPALIGVEIIVTGVALWFLMWTFIGPLPPGTESCLATWMPPGLIILGILVLVMGARRREEY